MNNKNNLQFLVGFGVGCVVGALVGYKMLKKKLEVKFEEKLNKEFDSAKRLKSAKKSENKPPIKECLKNKDSNNSEEKDKKEYENYADYYKSNASSTPTNSAKEVKDEQTEKKETKKRAHKGPYVISPDDFDSVDGYIPIWLTYYADGVLADDNNYEKVDIKSTIGTAALNKFGEYEKDVVHVRNDEKKCDYEVVKDNRTYEQAVNGEED